MKYTFPAPWGFDLTQCILLTNGLGGYCSVATDFSVPRADHAILSAAVKAPNLRITLVHRLQECLLGGKEEHFLSSQIFSDNTQPEEGFRLLKEFSYDYTPCWTYDTEEATVTRELAMGFEENTTALRYSIVNRSDRPLVLALTPFMKFAPKEMALEEAKPLVFKENTVSCNGYTLYIHTNGVISESAPQWQTYAYPEDAKDGRPLQGMAGSCCKIHFTIQAGQAQSLEVVFSDKPQSRSASVILNEQAARLSQVEESCPVTDPIARRLARSADAYIARRDSTGGKTILAGYPLFSDWGRDTMIALCGCTLSTGRYEDAKSILRTFLAYEQEGLVPNLFPEGDQAPMYNTVDAALLLIDCVWEYYRRTGDRDFLAEAYPVLERIVAAYRAGTRHGIGMDADGLIFAGQGLDQVTWMDVCCQGILPTPRHGKPVEINAYWYNGLRIMDDSARILDNDPKDYRALAETVKSSFNEKFYMPEKGYLKDVLSGTSADTQIRCNQIWALSMTHRMLPEEAERRVLETVKTHLLTSCGLRTLSPQDPQYHGFYGGSMFDRDMAYHQGTTWVFPMGAYYRAALRILQDPKAVRHELQKLLPMMEQGCLGQLPEIYDGKDPYEGKGCFGQAWSVGEMLRVLEDLQAMEE